MSQKPIEEITWKTRVPEDNGLFHDSRGSIRVVIGIVNKLIDKINEVIKAVNELKQTVEESKRGNE